MYVCVCRYHHYTRVRGLKINHSIRLQQVWGGGLGVNHIHIILFLLFGFAFLGALLLYDSHFRKIGKLNQSQVENKIHSSKIAQDTAKKI